MNNPENPLYEDPDYVQGQLAALQALILGLAQNQSLEEFRDQSLIRLENLKTSMLDEPISESRILAVEHCISWVLRVT